MVIAQASDIKTAFAARARHVEAQVPEGKTFSEFVTDMVVQAAQLPDMQAYDGYEIESIIREMAQPH